MKITTRQLAAAVTLTVTAWSSVTAWSQSAPTPELPPMLPVSEKITAATADASDIAAVESEIE